MKPIVFVIMPFGKKRIPNGTEFDFDKLYSDVFEPLSDDEELGLTFIREDFSLTNGIIHKTMFEKILLSEFVVADISSANVNAYYELGIRHCAKKQTTLMIFSDNKLPFDISPIRSIKYDVDTYSGYMSEEEIDHLKMTIKKKLIIAKTNKEIDSPIYELLPNADISLQLKDYETKSFKQYAIEASQRIQSIKKIVRDCNRLNREQSIEDILNILNDIECLESNITIFQEAIRGLTDIEAYIEVIKLADSIPQDLLKLSSVFYEKKGFALNRIGNHYDAIETLMKCMHIFGESAEIYGLLGRIYKDLYKKTEDEVEKEGLLQTACETYYKGFEFDSSDYYTGINAANLLFTQGSTCSIDKMNAILPVIDFELNKLNNITSNFWALATLINCYILEGKFFEAHKYTQNLVAMNVPPWQIKTTLESYDMLCKIYLDRGTKSDYLSQLCNSLENKNERVSLQ